MRSAALALALLAPSLAAADTIALLPATGVNVPEGEVAAATEVFRIHLEQTGFTVVLVPSPAAAGQEPTAVQAAAVARSAGARFAVTLHIARVGATARVRLAAYDPVPGPPARIDEMAAAGPDDLDPALHRLAKGLATGPAARSLAEIDTVTHKEAQPLLKMPARNLAGIRLGTAVVMSRAVATDSQTAVSGIGLLWAYDARDFMADVGVHGAWSQTLDLRYRGRRDWLVSVGMGAYYPFTKGNVAPYLGGGAALTWCNFGGDGAQGITLNALAGMLLGRLTTAQVRFELGWFLNTFSERDPVSGRERLGHGPTVSVVMQAG